MVAREQKAPNIIFILADDLGYWALGCNGNQEIQSPNIDALALSGIRLENFFCASPICSPARASILTGQIPSQHGIHDAIFKGNLIDMATKPSELPGIPVDDRAIEYLMGMRAYTEVLAEHGYTCGFSGKWHLGDSLNPQVSNP